MKVKIAIALFKDRISPRFDVCPEVWIVELDNGKVISQEKWPMESFNLQRRLDRLTSEGVDKIICGGIDSFCVDYLGNMRIDVIHNVAGEARTVLNLFKKGVLRPGLYCNGKTERGFGGEKEAKRKHGLRRGEKSPCHIFGKN